MEGIAVRLVSTVSATYAKLPTNILNHKVSYMLRHEPRHSLALRRLRHSRIRKRSRSREAVRNSPGRGPAEYFTGSVRIEPLFSVHDPSRAIGANVTFMPGKKPVQLGSKTQKSGEIHYYCPPAEINGLEVRVLPGSPLKQLACDSLACGKNRVSGCSEFCSNPSTTKPGPSSANALSMATSCGWQCCCVTVT
jgi:hypothetical protein